MGIGKERPTLGKAIYVRRLYLRVRFKSAEPVVPVVDGDEQHVRTLARILRVRRCPWETACYKEEHKQP